MQNSIVGSISKKNQTIITDLDSGEIVCSKCGVVISDKIQDTRQEWRNFLNSEEDRRRTGMRTSLASHDMGLYTMIGRGRKDARGQVLDASMRSTMGRLRTWDLRTQASANNNNNNILAGDETLTKVDVLTREIESWKAYNRADPIEAAFLMDSIRKLISRKIIFQS